MSKKDYEDWNGVDPHTLRLFMLSAIPLAIIRVIILHVWGV